MTSCLQQSFESGKTIFDQIECLLFLFGNSQEKMFCSTTTFDKMSDTSTCPVVRISMCPDGRGLNGPVELLMLSVSCRLRERNHQGHRMRQNADSPWTFKSTVHNAPFRRGSCGADRSQLSPFRRQSDLAERHSPQILQH